MSLINSVHNCIKKFLSIYINANDTHLLKFFREEKHFCLQMSPILIIPFILDIQTYLLHEACLPAQQTSITSFALFPQPIATPRLPCLTSAAWFQCANGRPGSKKQLQSAKCKYCNNYLLVFGAQGASLTKEQITAANSKPKVMIG